MNHTLSDDLTFFAKVLGIAGTDAIVQAGNKLNRVAMRLCPPYALRHDRKIYRMMVVEPACGGSSQFNIKAKEPICHNGRIRLPRQR